jgi:hypothetical protein
MSDRILRRVGMHTTGLFEVTVALGDVAGWHTFNKFGHNPDVDIGTEDVWGQGGIRVLPSGAAIAVVTSDDDADDGSPAGDGCRTLIIEGLDENYARVTATVLMNGQSNVNTTQEFLRINRMYVETVGDDGSNAGNITATVGGAVQAQIEALEGQTEQAAYTVPAEQTVVIEQVFFSTGRIGAGDLRMTVQTREPTGGWRSQMSMDVYEGSYIVPAAIVLTEQCEIRVQATSSLVNISVGARLHGYRIENKVLNP